MATERQRIEVKLPLPSAIANRLTQAVGAAWPDAVIDTSAKFHPEVEALVFLVPSDADPGLPLDQAVFRDDGQVEMPPGIDAEAVLASVHDGAFGMKMPEWFSRLMLEGVRATLDAHPDGLNYIEQQFTAEDPDQPGHFNRYTVTVGRPKGQTPHELRVAADGRAADAVALARRLLDRLTPARRRDLDLTPEDQALLDGGDPAEGRHGTWQRGRAPADGWSFGDAYQIDTTWYRNVHHPDGSVAFRCSVEGLVRHGSKNAAVPE